jgi:glycerophosphoryl diester phosphodiesterase
MLADAHPQALLQLDMKDGFEAIGPKGIDHLRHHFANATGALIISARDLDLIVAVRKSLPDLRRGIDPTGPLVRILRDQGAAAAEARLRHDILGPSEPDTVYLGWELVLAAAADGLDLIGIAHDLGRRVDAWTFNLADRANGFDAAEAANFSRLIALRPDQITTDEPGATERAWIKLCSDEDRQSKIGSRMT